MTAAWRGGGRAGAVAEGRVAAVDDRGLLVSLGEGVRLRVPSSHLAEVVTAKTARKFKARPARSLPPLAHIPSHDAAAAGAAVRRGRRCACACWTWTRRRGARAAR